MELELEVEYPERSKDPNLVTTAAAKHLMEKEGELREILKCLNSELEVEVEYPEKSMDPNMTTTAAVKHPMEKEGELRES